MHILKKILWYININQIVKKINNVKDNVEALSF